MNYDALPHVGRAALLHQAFRDRLRTELQELLSVSASLLGIPLEPLIRSISQLRNDLPYNPNLYTAHWRLSHGLRTADLQTIRTALQALVIQLGSLSVYLSGFDVRSISEETSDHAIREWVTGTEGPIGPEGQRAEMCPLADENIRALHELVEAAVRIIGELDSGVSDELREYARRLCLFQGSVVTGITSVRAFGAIYLRVPRSGLSTLQESAYFVEHLVHESSHLQLHAMMLHDPLVLNSDAMRYKAPIRPDTRPMYGVFHATFVLSRMVRVFAAWACRDSNPIVSGRLAEITKMFESGLATIREHGRLSQAGQEVFQSLQAVAGGRD